MNLTNILANASNSLTGNQSTSYPSTAAPSALASNRSPLAKANARIQKEADATRAQLSKMGLMKSSVAALQSPAKAIANLAADASASSVTTTMANLFNAVTAAITTAKAGSAASEGATSANSARRVSADLRQALSSGIEVDSAMRKLGIKLTGGGTLMQDAKVFARNLAQDPAALRNALKVIGARVGTVADKELASKGNLESTVTALNQRGSLLAAQQKAIKAYAL